MLNNINLHTKPNKIAFGVYNPENEQTQASSTGRPPVITPTSSATDGNAIANAIQKDMEEFLGRKEDVSGDTKKEIVLTTLYTVEKATQKAYPELSKAIGKARMQYRDRDMQGKRGSFY